MTSGALLRARNLLTKRRKLEDASHEPVDNEGQSSQSEKDTSDNNDVDMSNDDSSSVRSDDNNRNADGNGDDDDGGNDDGSNDTDNGNDDDDGDDDHDHDHDDGDDNDDDDDNDDFDEIHQFPTQTAYKSNELKLTLKQTQHRRAKRFKLDDHLFVGHIETRGKRHPKIESVVESISSAMEKSLLSIQKHYTRENNNYVFTTICERDIQNGLNTGMYSLFADPKMIATHAFHLLHSYLQSHKDMKLNKSFKFYFLVLSVPHMNALKKKRKKQHEGRSQKEANDDPEWLLRISSLFQGRCVPAAVAAGFIIAEGQDSYLYQNIARINGSCPNKQHYGKKLLEQKMRELCIEYNIPMEGPHNLQETLQEIASKEDVIFRVFSDTLNELELSVPEDYSYGKKEIFLYSEKGEKVHHLNTIRNFNLFFSATHAGQKLCLACLKRHSKDFPHWCPKKKDNKKVIPQCESCRRPLLREGMHVPNDKRTRRKYCDSQILNDKKHRCAKCNIICTTDSCLKAHKPLRVCARIYKCEQCGRVMQTNSKLNQSAIAKKHKCDGAYCRKCNTHIGERLLASHQCPLFSSSVPKVWGKIGFLCFQTVDHSCGNCMKCFKENKPCGMHTFEVNENAKINMASILLQKNGKRFEGKLDAFIIADSLLNIPDEKLLDFDFELPQEITSYELKKCNQTPPTFKNCSKDLCMEEKLWQWFHANKGQVRNTTFIVNNEDPNVMTIITDIFIRQHKKPHVLEKKGRTILIEVPELAVRFVDLQRFRKITDMEIFEETGVPPVFFPHSLNSPKNYDEAFKTVPDLDYFLKYTDDDAAVAAKKDFVASLQQFNFKKLLKEELLSRIHALALCSFKYLEDCAQMQKLVQESCDNKGANLLNPFSKPICGANGYIAKLYRSIGIPKGVSIHQLKKKIGLRCSSMELRLAECIKEKAENKSDVHSFYSPYGHPKIGSTFPDIVWGKRVYFVHGCVWHRHLSPSCPRAQLAKEAELGNNEEDMRKYKANLQSIPENVAKNELHNKKIAELKTLGYEPITIWECDLKNLLKRTGYQKDLAEKLGLIGWQSFDEFKNFYYNIVDKPLTRLEPRNCCKFVQSITGK